MSAQVPLQEQDGRPKFTLFLPSLCVPCLQANYGHFTQVRS